MKVIPLFFALILFGCNGCREHEPAGETNHQQVQDDLIASTRAKHHQEMDRIKKFIRDKKWPMTETPTGLQYWIYEQGSGETAKKGDMAVVTYRVELLDGTLCYSADESKPGRFIVGEDNVESGLHEIILFMRPGDRARVIMPSHLAFGFTGDSDRIPRESTLFYDIHLLAIE